MSQNGFVRDKQRYQCQQWGYNFVRGDERHSPATEVKKALCLIFYSLGKASFGFLAKLFGVSRTTTYYWIRQAAASMDEPTIAPDIRAIELSVTKIRGRRVDQAAHSSPRASANAGAGTDRPYSR